MKIATADEESSTAAAPRGLRRPAAAPPRGERGAPPAGEGVPGVAAEEEKEKFFRGEEVSPVALALGRAGEETGWW